MSIFRFGLDGLPGTLTFVSYILLKYHQNTTSCQLNISNANTSARIVRSKFANANIIHLSMRKIWRAIVANQILAFFGFARSRPVFLTVVDKFAVEH